MLVSSKANDSFVYSDFYYFVFFSFVCNQIRLTFHIAHLWTCFFSIFYKGYLSLFLKVILIFRKNLYKTVKCAKNQIFMKLILIMW